MCRADRPLSLGAPDISLPTLVASTVRSLRAGSLANQRPIVSSVYPLCTRQPYMLAVSTKLRPRSRARFRMRCPSSSSTRPPKLTVPTHSLLIFSAVRPKRV